MTASRKPKPVTLIAPLGDPSRRVRLAKVIALLRDNYGQNIRFFGWQREESEPLGSNIDGVISGKALVKGGGYRSKWTRPMYLLWVWAVFWKLLFTGPRQVYALGLETALPVWMASRMRPKIKYIFDDADRLVTFWSVPALAEKIIVFLEKRVSKAASTHLVPTLERYDYRTDKMEEIANLPNKEQVDEAWTDIGAPPDDALNIYVCGWLDPTRGLDLLDGAAAALEAKGRSDIVFNIAIGRLTQELPPFFDRPAVNMLGTLSHIESLRQYTRNHAVVTFYDPAIKVNRYALPNKWGDAITMQCPIIMNSEVQTGRALLADGAAFAIPFHEPEALADLLIALRDNPDKLAAAKQAVIAVRPQYKFFDEAMAPSLRKFLQI